MASRAAFHPWTESTETPGLHTRSLATPEFMLSMLNEYALGHNCPYLGVSISVQSPLTVQQLETRLKHAFIHTRWVHPAVACQIRDSKQMAYPVEDTEHVEKWASRTAQTIEAEGGWPQMHEKLSREVVLPSADGDCAFIYAIVSPEEARKVQISEFHLLLHVHHGLADGAGLRSMMNEVLVGLGGSGGGGGDASQEWGKEIDRLSPAALDVAVISEDVTKALAAMPKEIPLPPLEKPALDAARQGTGVVSHSFEGVGFLDGVLGAARAHDVKLTAVVQAGLALAVFDAIKPTAEENCTVLSGFDLRARNLEEPWSQRNRFVGAAVGLEMMTIPVSALSGDHAAEGADGRFWTVARHMQGIWTTAAQRKDVAAANELRRGATGFIIKGVLDSIKAPTSGVSLSFNYVSDPAGSSQLDGAYGQGEGGMKMTLDRYQLVTDESTAKLSCRSHSWNDTLSLCISFNKDRHQEADVQKILDGWVKVIEEACQA